MALRAFAGPARRLCSGVRTSEQHSLFARGIVCAQGSRARRAKIAVDAAGKAAAAVHKHRPTIDHNSPILAREQTRSMIAEARKGHARGICTANPALHGEEWSEHEYMAAARAALDAIYEGVMAAHEHGGGVGAFGPEFDAEFDGGVVRIYLGSTGGTYVANTQTPNRQIWLSSPVSGPWRYGWSPERRTWVSTRDGHALIELLERELSEVSQSPVKIPLNVSET